MQALIVYMEQCPNATLNRDRWRDLLMIDDFEAIQHKFLFL
jgi:hypothetical protein